MIAYDVFCGVYSPTNPGPHAIAMVTVCGDKRNEWSHRFRERAITTPRAWILVVDRALARVNRPEASVTIAVHDRNLVHVLMTGGPDPTHPTFSIARILATRPNTAVTWLPKRDRQPEMVRAHDLAMVAFGMRVSA